jgi:hypothetical protein
MIGRALASAAAWLLPCFAFAATPVPACRLDDELAPAVRLAAQWALQDLKAGSMALAFDDVAINPRGAVPARTLRIEIVKDAAASTVDQDGCIRAMRWRAGDAILQSDGACVPTRLDACTEQDRQYMQQRFREIHGNLIGDSQTGYEFAGACYMTNLHACLNAHRRALLQALGPRDALSVKGTCLASAREPVGIKCSAGALKLLLSSEAVAAKATTLAIVTVLGHELGHLAANASSTYDAADYVVDLAWASADKLARIRNQCRAGESLRQRERDADEIGLRIAERRLGEIARRWPAQGTTAWLITQAGHQATNLVRWNNDWRDAPDVETPRVFRQSPDGGVLRLDQKDIEAAAAGKLVSGRSPQEIASAARRFLCELTATRTGRWDVLIQSGSTHGTMTERLGEMVATLRPKGPAKDAPGERMEALLGQIADAALSRHRAYLRELEGAICTLVEQPLDCSDAALAVPAKPPAADKATPGPRAASGVRLPLAFAPKGPYREVAGDPGVLTIAIGTYKHQPTMEQATELGRQIAEAYTSLFAQIDTHLRAQGGYWIAGPPSDVEVDYNMFSRDYMATVQWRAIARVPGGFKPETLPALQRIRTWGRAEDVRVRRWDDARHDVVIHFFRRATPGANKDSQRVITNGLRFDQIYDLAAAASGRPNEPAPFFRDLLPFLHGRLKAAFGGAYTLQHDHPPAPFYITSTGIGDNFYLPAAWHGLIDSTHARATPDHVLAAAVRRVFIDNSREQDVAAIFGRPKP